MFGVGASNLSPSKWRLGNIGLELSAAMAAHPYRRRRGLLNDLEPSSLRHD
jgi:hypothetical protein